MEEKETKQNNKKRNIIILVAILLVAAVIAAIVYVNTRPTEVTNYNSAVFEEEQTKSDVETEDGSVTAGIQIPGYTSITIAADTTDVSVELVNPEENNVYFQISFYLPDTDETIYTSDLIKPGQTIYDITLERAMEVGEYDMTVIYSTFTADDEMSPRNGAEVNTTLIVK